MAVRVEEHTVVCIVSAASGSPDDVMIVPTRETSDFLVADRANPILLFPEVKQLSSSPEIICHFHAQTFFEVDFPLWIVWVCFTFDFSVPLDGRTGCAE